MCEEEQIDAHFHKGGILGLARGVHQLPIIRSAYASCQRLGLGDHHHLLSADELAQHLKVTNAHGALYSPQSAGVHPGRLVRGLARAVERRGGVIYEQTPVSDFSGGKQARLLTQGGELRAKKAIVLAGEAYLTRLAKLHRTLIPVYSLIVLTEPLSGKQWSGIGWRNSESVFSNKFTVDYLTKTSDGRILFGSRGAPYMFGSRITDEQDRHAESRAHRTSDR